MNIVGRLFICRQLRARRALLQTNDVPLRTRRALLPWALYSNSTLLVLNGTSLNCNNALLALNWRCEGVTAALPFMLIAGMLCTVCICTKLGIQSHYEIYWYWLSVVTISYHIFPTVFPKSFLSYFCIMLPMQVQGADLGRFLAHGRWEVITRADPSAPPSPPFPHKRWHYLCSHETVIVET